jgi:ornithine cyclodeaminase
VLGVLGAGRQSRALALAYCKAYSLERVQVWARQIRAAQALADELAPLCGVAVSCSTVDEAVEGASIVTSATPSTAPLVRSAAVSDQSHVDLVGSFRPDMREADDQLVNRAFVVADCEAALAESGDLAQPLGAGVIKRGDVHLFSDLLGGGVKLPPSKRPTLFKSVGHAGLDLIAVRHLLAKLGLGAQPPQVSLRTD